MPRQARLDYPGALHHVIARGIEKSSIFKEDGDKKEFLRRVETLLRKSSVRCYAWCLMDNHCHLLLLTVDTKLSEFMSRLLTGYAVYYNHVHKRVGHLFQNRYKSLLCDRDEYLLSLIRYIHLNPVRGKKIDFARLSRYRWAGHQEILEDKREGGIIAGKEVLSYFGKTEKKAKQAYLEYIAQGVALREDYSIGEMARGVGGRRRFLKREAAENEMYDERILGSGLFVEEVYKKEEKKEELPGVKIKRMSDLIEKVSEYYKVERRDLINTKKREVREARKVLIYLASRYLGEKGTATGKLLGIGSGAVSVAKEKGRILCEEKGIIEQLFK